VAAHDEEDDNLEQIIIIIILQHREGLRYVMISLCGAFCFAKEQYTRVERV